MNSESNIADCPASGLADGGGIDHSQDVPRDFLSIRRPEKMPNRFRGESGRPRYAPSDHTAHEGVDDQSQVRSTSLGRCMGQVGYPQCVCADACNPRFARAAELASATLPNVVLAVRPRTGPFSPNSPISRRTIQRAITTLSRLSCSQTMRAPQDYRISRYTRESSGVTSDSHCRWGGGRLGPDSCAMCSYYIYGTSGHTAQIASTPRLA